MFGLFGGAKPQVQKISHEEAKRIMQEEKDVLVVDVRTPGEYRDGHIPGAINIPNETIAKKENIEVTEADLEEEYAKMAEAYKMDAEKVKAAVPADSLTEDIKVQKALDLVKNSAVIK